ncbi:putative ADP-ribosylation factor GTPase-activating protein AGD5 [Zea mays]|nr:putative ADP-ribosylation factor GTPase-activating protein AGD5 [Zea mays]
MLLSDTQQQQQQSAAPENSSRKQFGRPAVAPATRFTHVEIPIGPGDPPPLVSECEEEPPVEHAFAKCLGGLVSVVMQEVHLELAFPTGEITAVYSCRPGQQVVAVFGGTGVSMRLGEMYAEEERELLVEVRAPLGSHPHSLTVRCMYRNPASQETMNESLFTCELSKQTLSSVKDTVEMAVKKWGEKSLTELEAEKRLSYSCEKVITAGAMGNEKANSHWEAELPPKYDRVGIENFIRAKYEDKRWVPRNGTLRLSSGVRDEKSQESPASANWSGHHRSSFEQNHASPALPSKVAPVASRIPSQASPQPPKVEPPVPKVVSPPQPQKSPAKVEATPPKVEKPSVAPPPKVDYATDLFNMLSMDGTIEKEPESSPNDDNAWDGFQSAQPVPSSEEKDSAKPAESKTQSTSGIEDLFKDSPAVSLSSAPVVSQENAKNDIMSLFEKSDMASPFAVQQQQLAFMSQQQALLMAALKAGNSPQIVPGNANQLNTNISNPPLGTLPFQNWTNLGYQNPGLTLAAAQNGATMRSISVS